MKKSSHENIEFQIRGIPDDRVLFYMNPLAFSLGDQLLDVI